MSNASNLLRMLEPAVRPGNLPTQSTATKARTFEDSSFESLLQQVQTQGNTGASSPDGQNFTQINNTTNNITTNTTTPSPIHSSAKPSVPFSMLGVSNIENASLINLIAKQNATSAANQAASVQESP